MLANDENFFNIIFYLQDLNKEIAKEAFEFLNVIATNPKIYKQLLFIGKSQEDIKWESQLDEKNIYKLIYSLQIIESFLEDIEISSEKVESFSNEEVILGMKDISLRELKNLKMEWMRVFIKNNGYSYLISILEKKLGDYANNIKNNAENSLMSNICLDLLLRISRIIYSSSLNKFKVYREVNRYIDNLRGNKPKEIISEVKEELTTSTNSANNNEDILKLNRQNSRKVATSELENFFSGELGDKILNSVKNKDIVINLIEVLSSLTDNKTRTEEETNIIVNSFSFLCGLLGFSPNSSDIEKSLIDTKSKEFKNICLFGILNKEENTRILFSNSLITLCNAAKFKKIFKFIHYLFTFIFLVIENMDQNLEKISSEIFDLFSNLFEVYLSCEDEIVKSNTII